MRVHACVYNLLHCKICYSFSGRVPCLMQMLAIENTQRSVQRFLIASDDPACSIARERVLTWNYAASGYGCIYVRVFGCCWQGNMFMCVSCLTSSCPLPWAVHMTQLGGPWLWAMCCPVPKSGPIVTSLCGVCVCVCRLLYAVQHFSKLGNQSAGFPQHCSHYNCSPLMAGAVPRHRFWFELRGTRRLTGMFITMWTTCKAAAWRTNVNTNMWAMTV